jgi:hypothetical protein
VHADQVHLVDPRPVGAANGHLEPATLLELLDSVVRDPAGTARELADSGGEGIDRRGGRPGEELRRLDVTPGDRSRLRRRLAE